MSQNVAIFNKIASIAVVGAVVITMTAGLDFSKLKNITINPMGDPLASQMAAVTIKTQQAADNAVEDGAIRGIDVSQYQGNINWAKVAKDNVNFAICRASLGTTMDTHFYANAKSANENGIAVGAYHYAKFTDYESMVREAKYFLSVVKNVDITYPVILDVEASRGMSRSTLTDLCNEFMHMIKDAGYTPMLYSYSNFYRDYLNPSKIEYDLWVANYMEQPSTPAHTIWQHTSYGSVDGISGRVDINVAFENLSKRGVRVNKAISDTIKATLNERYNAGLPTDALDMQLMHDAVISGIQSELVRQIGAKLEVTGVFNNATLDSMMKIPFTPNETKGSITYLFQVKLFYKGFYTTNLTGAYDEEMVSAVKKFQRSNSIAETGQLDKETLNLLVS